MKRESLWKRNNGISLITVIITIVVIIILAAISFYSISTQKNAAMAKYVQEFEELRKNVETKRIANSKIRNVEYR